MKSTSKYLIAAFYLALFAQFPLQGHLPGNSDTLLSISLTNIFDETIGLFFRHQPLDTIMYPARNFLAYGENCFGLGFIFSAFKLPFGSDHLAYYFFLSTIFTLNSCALFRLIKGFVKSPSVALVGSLVLPLSNFCLSNIDDANVIFVFFPVLAIASVREALQTGDVKKLNRAALLSSLQIWFGMYVFVFQALVMALLSLVFFRKLKAMLARRDLVRLFLLYVLPAAPLVALYVWNHFESDLVFAYENGLSRQLSSLHFYDFWNVLPGNLLYSAKTNFTRRDFDMSLWYSMRRYAFPGVMMPLLALLGALRTRREKGDFALFLGIAFLFFLALAFGKNLFAYDEIELIPFGTYFRVASRAYLFALIPLSVMFAIGLQVVVDRVSRTSRLVASVVPIFAALVFVVENVPFPLPSYDYKGRLEPEPGYVSYFARSSERQVVADIPSTYKAELPQDGALWTYSRDALYMNWQTYHHQIIVGGINSYLPRSRTEVEAILLKLPADQAVSDLIRFGVHYVIFHKKFVLFPEEMVLDGLKGSRKLGNVFEDGDVVIFRLIGE